MTNPLNGPQVRDLILKHGYSATEAAAYSWGNITQGVANTGKATLTAQCGNRVGSGAFKATKDFSRGDIICGTLCSLSIGCETACAVVTWLPIPTGKFATIAVLKGISHASTKFRDLCAMDPSNPVC
eukprot:scaffold24649_cov2193-Cylindrotheca_fusiformis.AAC.14